MGFYEKHILPNMIHWACSGKDIRRERKKIIPHARGRVLEVGIGSGLNLPFYNPDLIDRLWGLDPSKPLQKIAEKKADDIKFPVEFIDSPAEQIPLDNNSADTVVVFYTLCSIQDVTNALKEMNRVLKPGGKLIFCEHCISPDEVIKKYQDRLNPLWKIISNGCNLNRPVPEIIKNAGFKITTLEMKYINAFKPVSFNYQGFAVNG